MPLGSCQRPHNSDKITPVSGDEYVAIASPATIDESSMATNFREDSHREQCELECVFDGNALVGAFNGGRKRC